MTKTPAPASHAVNTAPVGFIAQASIDSLSEHLDAAKVFLTKEGLLDYFPEATPVALYAQPSRECLQQSAEAEVLLRVIQRLNQNPYGLTKSECISEVSAMRDAALQAAPPAPAGVAVPTDSEIIALLGDPKYSTITAVREALQRWGAAAPAQAVAVTATPAQPVGRASDEGRVEWFDPIPEGGAFVYAAPTQRPRSPGSFVNAAGIHASDKPATVVRKLNAAFHDAVTFADTPAPAQEHVTQLAGQGRDLEVTDEMALAFHRAISDGAIGQNDVDEIKDGLRAAFCNIAAPDQAQEDAPVVRAGLLAAAAHIQAKASAYAEECGTYDPDTGAFEMRDAVQDHYNTLDELAEEIRLLADKAVPEACDKPPAGWACRTAAG